MSDNVANRLFSNGELSIARRHHLNATDGLICSLTAHGIGEIKLCERVNVTIAFVTRVKNQACAVNDYLAHHFLLGVSHIILVVDRTNNDNLLNVVRPWVDIGRVTLRRQKDNENLDELGNHMFQRAIQDFDWVGYIDLDEFVMPYHHHCLTDLLSTYQHYAGVKLKWSEYQGPLTSAYLHGREFPAVPILEALNYTLGRENAMTKEIGQSRYLKGVASGGRMPHCLDYKHELRAVDEKFTSGSDANGKVPCWVAGGSYPDAERLVGLLHVHPITLKGWLDRNLRNINSQAHAPADETRFDLYHLIDEFFSHPMDARPMPQQMKTIASRLTSEVRALFTACLAAPKGPHRRPPSSTSLNGSAHRVPASAPSLAVVTAPSASLALVTHSHP
jgi:hypothetical protein